jgi:hypothetical protein
MKTEAPQQVGTDKESLARNAGMALPGVEADLSASSYGFRPGRNAHQAVKAAKQYVAEGRRFVVDMDLEKFSKKIGDGRVLRLIRRYLEAGMMVEGIVSPRTEGTPQGGPLRLPVKAVFFACAQSYPFIYDLRGHRWLINRSSIIARICNIHQPGLNNRKQFIITSIYFQNSLPMMYTALSVTTCTSQNPIFG